jgi:hypothetical protein
MSRRNRALPRGWYPFDGKDCRRKIESYLEEWKPSQIPSSKGLGELFLMQAGIFLGN